MSPLELKAGTHAYPANMTAFHPTKRRPQLVCKEQEKTCKKQREKGEKDLSNKDSTINIFRFAHCKSDDRSYKNVVYWFPRTFFRATSSQQIFRFNPPFHLGNVPLLDLRHDLPPVTTRTLRSPHVACL
jgi:hypothetical protein